MNPVRYDAGSSEEFLEGVIVSKTLGGRDLILIRRLGRVQCFLDQCSHQPIKLSEFGELSAGRLVCHAHAGTFDMDQNGAVVSGPPCEGLTSFRCEEDAQQVSVYI